MLTKKVKKRVSFLTIFLALTVLGVFSILKTLDRNLCILSHHLMLKQIKIFPTQEIKNWRNGKKDRLK